MVKIYTTAKIEVFDIVASDFEKSDITVFFHSYPPYEVIATYEVTVMLPEAGEETKYTIDIETEEKIAVSQEITVAKAESRKSTQRTTPEFAVTLISCIFRSKCVHKSREGGDS